MDGKGGGAYVGKFEFTLRWTAFSNLFTIGVASMPFNTPST